MAASIEQKKEIYSKQLAAHTLRQWNAVRQEPVAPRREKTATSPTTQSDAERDDQGNENVSHDRDNDSSGQLTPSSRQTANGRRGVHVVDYGSRRSPKRSTQ
ncbi:hypothetical protein GALMADRAFT_217872 [Galerina marginata CBS 339.88]|uniref:Uncharacterized protein n=1 Tax=Galerina marginata (strain CBS 339.88) TaxID=685588 RepID=A0A067TNI8_GALM3|nr:hypothetical protein GALMADRAFT_217872 [Galerina marginata CBS 339.88]